MRAFKIGLAALVVSGLAVLVLAPAASADTVGRTGVVQATQYSGGTASAGGYKYEVAVEYARDPAGDIVNVRAAATIAKVSKVAKVQVDLVRLGTASTALLTNSTPANSGSAISATSRTGWYAVAPKTCTSYRVRANLSIRWDDGALTRLSVLTPLTQVCRPTSPPVYKTCADMNKVFPHGVGRPGARDHTTGTPVTTFYVSAYIYNANAAGRDADKDGIACEKS